MTKSVTELHPAPVVTTSQRAESSSPGDACLACGGSLQVILADLTDNRLGCPGSWQIRQCTRCGFEQTGPLPDQAQLTRLYEEHYNFGGQTDTLYTRLREKFLLSGVYRLWTKIDGDVGFHSRRGHGRLIDVGCNEGRSLRIFAGYEMFAITHDAHDLNGMAGLVLEIAADGVFGVEHAPGEFLIHDGNGRSGKQVLGFESSAHQNVGANRIEVVGIALDP